MADSGKFDEPTTATRATAAKWAAAARALMSNGQTETAAKLALRIWKEAADEPEAAMMAAGALSEGVPEWHFKLVLDRVRNASYDAALRRAIRPGMTVLDIGAGTGLLAMMAARAGAGRVYSCEMNPAVADAAVDVIAANGLSDQVRVIAKHSGKLQAEADLGGRVDLIVSEVVSNDMLGEGALETLEHASKDLLKPGGRMIPAKGTVRVALAFDPRAEERLMGTTDGFDLTAFNRLAAPHYLVSSFAKRFELRMRSESADLFAFDFLSAAAPREGRAELVLKARGGPANCVVQWIHLEMDEAGTYENRPDSADYSCWAVVVHRLFRQAVLPDGSAITVHGSHDLNAVRIWAAVE